MSKKKQQKKKKKKKKNSETIGTTLPRFAKIAKFVILVLGSPSYSQKYKT